MKELNIKVVVKKPYEPGKICTVPNELESFQEIVDGYIETYPLREDIFLVLNEEGKLMNLDLNFVIPCEDGYCEHIVGNVIITGIDKEFNFASLNNEQIQFLKRIGLME